MKVVSTLIRTAFVVLAVLSLTLTGGRAQKSSATKRLLFLYWYDRDYPGNVRFDQFFRTALRSASHGTIDYYSEYLETNLFPGESQSRLLRDYLRQKYADVSIDVLVVSTPPALDFFLKYRSDLFPHAPIIFATTESPSAEQLALGPGATGVLYVNTHRETLDLALKLHPDTEQVFIVSGANPIDTTGRKSLEGYPGKVAIHYLTDLPLEELLLRVKNLPEKSIVLYVRQQLSDRLGKLLESPDVLAILARSARVPIYGMTETNVGLGIVGGYVFTTEANAAKLAELAVRVAHGARPADIPVKTAPYVPMFDWRQLQRWNIPESRLPPGSVIRYQELSTWQKHKWRIVAAVVLILFQASLIGALLVGRRRTRRTQLELQNYKEHLEVLVQDRTMELVEARDQALAANRAKSVFLANMSHELRTPLNSILGFSAMVLADSNLSEQHRKDLSLVGSSGAHLLSLIDDVLDMAKIETGSIVVESAPFDLSALVRDTVSMMQERAQAKNLSLSLDVAGRAPVTLLSDAGKLRQVLINLIGNAVKYTDQGGVVVRVDAKPRDRPSQVMLIFDIEDTGIGIAFEDQTRIFDPFIQAASLRNRQGTGLGLAISRHFVQALGGTIQVESTPGVGSRFHVEAPVTVAESFAPAPETSGTLRIVGLEPGQPECRILIVEDQRENWILLQRLLENAGFATRVVEDGLRAVEGFKSWRPHFIWMDLRLPVMNGMEAAKRIRALERGSEVKIAAVTASVFASQREEVLAAGFDDFLRKPYRPKEVFDCMARHLKLRYQYQWKPAPVAAETSTVLRPEDFSSLPANLRVELEDAVIALDHQRIARLVKRISEQDARLGRLLARFTDKLAYTPIFNALEKVQKITPAVLPPVK